MPQSLDHRYYALLDDVEHGQEWYSILEVALLFGVHRRTIERRIEASELLAVRVSPRRRRIHRVALSAYLVGVISEARMVAARSDHGKAASEPRQR